MNSPPKAFALKQSILNLIDTNLILLRTCLQLESGTLQKSTFQVSTCFSTRNTHTLHFTSISGYSASSCPLITVQLLLVNSSLGTLLTQGPSAPYSWEGQIKAKATQVASCGIKNSLYPTSVFHTTTSEVNKSICHFPGKTLPQRFKAAYPAPCRGFKRSCTSSFSRQSLPAASFQQSKSLHSPELTRE